MPNSVTRRGFLEVCAATALASRAEGQETVPEAAVVKRRPVIDITDLYHPHQDRGDNFDLISAYSLPEVDLRAVIFDVTDRYRRPYQREGDPYADPTGPREPGFITVQQLNYIFNRDVPCAAAPFQAMRSPDDAMRDAPRFQTNGIDLMLRVLEESTEPVDVVSFGSARPLAVAFNRAPGLVKEKIRMAHICAGAAPAGYLEWNVQLDPHAFVRVLRSDMNVAVYPCATDTSPFDLGPHNCYYSLPDLDFVQSMAAPLQRYIEYAFTRSVRQDFLGVLDLDQPLADMVGHYHHPHHVWETAVWEQVANRKIAGLGSGAFRLLPADEIVPGQQTVSSELLPCTFDVRDDGQFHFSLIDEPAGKFIYHRKNPQQYQDAIRQALPALYRACMIQP